MAHLITCTEPEICHYNHDLKKQWFVYFTVTNKTTGQKKRFQFRGDINKEKGKRARLIEAESIIEYWKGRIANGWNPWHQQDSERPIYPHTTFPDALDFALAKCQNAPDTIEQYTVAVHRAKESAQKVGLARRRISEVKKADIKLLLEQMRKDFDLSPVGYNRSLRHLSAVLSNLDEWDVNEQNPCHKIKKQSVTETERFVPLTEDEKIIIREKLPAIHYRLFVFINVLYSTGIRPKEILALKIKDVNMVAEEITIIPDLKTQNSKTKKIRRVPVDPHLMFLLRELNLDKYPPDYYVFGLPFMTVGGKQSKKIRIMHPDYLCPSPKQVPRHRVTDLWNDLVVEGLGVKKLLYSCKATGANDKIMAGISLDSLREIFGHSDKKMTLRYVSKMQEVAAKDIKSKAPKF